MTICTYWGHWVVFYMKWGKSPFARGGRLSTQRTFKPVAGNTNGLATEHLKCIEEYWSITRSHYLHISKSGMPVKFCITLLHSKMKQSTVSTRIIFDTCLCYPSFICGFKSDKWLTLPRIIPHSLTTATDLGREMAYRVLASVFPVRQHSKCTKK